MRFDLTKPCKECPFLKTSNYLRKERVKQIIEDISQNNKTFQCHKTLDSKITDQHCSGALIILEKLNLAIKNNTLMIAERLGIYNHKKLNFKAPVYNNFEEMINGHNF